MRKQQQCESFLRICEPVVRDLLQRLGRTVRVADFGCGSGNASLPLACKGGWLWGEACVPCPHLTIEGRFGTWTVWLRSLALVSALTLSAAVDWTLIDRYAMSVSIVKQRVEQAGLTRVKAVQCMIANVQGLWTVCALQTSFALDHCRCAQSPLTW